MLKNIIGNLDRSLLGGVLTRIYVKVIIKKMMRYKTDLFVYDAQVQYAKSDKSLLNSLADKYGSDKGEIISSSNPYSWASHTYADAYELIFQLGRKSVEQVVECGLGTNNPSLKSSMGINGKPGASLRMWKEYFPNARIVGCDIDRDVLFTEPRITTYYCDQTSEKSIESFIDSADILEKSVDIIIDDGLHEYHAGICFFENMIGRLRLDGVYIIEDVSHYDIQRYKDYFSTKSSQYQARFVYLGSPQRSLGDDNNIIVVTKC